MGILDTPVIPKDAHGRRIDSLDVGARFLRGKPNIALPTTASVLPTVTVNTVAGTYTSVVAYTQSSPRRFSFVGANVVRGATVANYSSPSLLVPQNANSFQAWGQVFITDSPKFDLSVAGFGGSLRILIDGAVAVPKTLIPSVGGGVRYINVDWAGVRALRTYRVEWDNAYWGSMVCAAVDTLRQAAISGPRAIFMGDSYNEGTGTDRYLNWAWEAGKLLGWDDTWSSGSGGTGYLYTPGAGKVKYRDRFTTCVSSQSPDVIVFAGGRNDGAGGFTAAQVGAEALTLYQQARTESPNALIIVCGNFVSGNADTYAAALCAALAASAAAVPGVIFLDPQNPAALINGTGKVGTPTNNGNADFITSADGVHPTPAGHDLLGGWFASELAIYLPNT